MLKLFYSVLFVFILSFSFNVYAQDLNSENEIREAMLEQSLKEKIKPSTMIKAEDSPAYKIYARVVSKVAIFAGKVADVLDDVVIVFIPIFMISYICFLGIKAYLTNQAVMSFIAQQVGLFSWITFMLICYMGFEKYSVSIFHIFSLTSVQILNIADARISQSDASVKMAFKIAYDMYLNLFLITSEVWDLLGNDWSDYLSNIGTLVATGFLTAIYFAVYLAFTFLWSLNTVGFFIFISLGKAIIILAMFPKMKGYFWNWLEALVGFGVTLIFVAIAMAMTTFILGDTYEVASEYVSDGEITLLYTELMLVGLFSWFFHIKAPTFASMVLKSHISDFGQTFSAVSSMGGSLAKSLAPHLTGAMSKALMGGGKLSSSAISSGAEKVGDLSKKYLGKS